MSSPVPGGRPVVALLTREWPPDVYGGAGVHVSELARALEPHVEVRVGCFGPPRHDPLVAQAVEPWAALPADREGAALRALSVDLALAAGARGADLVHSHTWYANLGGLLAAQLWEVPHVVTCHSLEPLRPWKAEQLGGGYRVSSWAERSALESADAIVAVSAGMAADVVAAYPGVDPAAVSVIHNGIDAARWGPDPRRDAQARFGIDPTRPYVMWIGRVTRQKGIAHLLDAVAHLDPDIEVVCCAGAADTADLAAEVDAAVAALRTGRGGVHWIEGMLPHDDVVQLLSGAACFVCPSTYEPFGLINLEAMACEVPVVASAVGGIPEIVVDGVTGRLVPFDAAPDGSPADPARFARDLAAAVGAVVGRTDRAELGRAGRRRVLERFTWEAVAADTAALYRRLLGR
ncbi:MAG TPA: glycogen synthase [Acidimicrobiales bacterium]|nr:glycogen synthase [Acidimicrobiales bacterium]